MYTPRRKPSPLARARRTFSESPFFYVVAVIMGGVVLFGLYACGSVVFSGNKDPRVGKVYVDYQTYKVCDGSTLIYKDMSKYGNLSVVANSSECGAR